ncbi:MAG: acyltransferase [Bacteroidales bacterium]|nr:acyltransferase [Bacteroidales bacterium]
MISSRLYITELIMRLLPETKAFGFKNRLLRWSGARIGKNVRICSSVRITGIGEFIVGDDVWIGPGTFISSTLKIEIGSHVDIAPCVYIGTGTHEIDPVGFHSAGKGISKSVYIGSGVWLCARSVILPGVSIGKKAIVGAGAVVNRSCCDGDIVAGVPAKVVKRLW